MEIEPEFVARPDTAGTILGGIGQAAGTVANRSIAELLDKKIMAKAQYQGRHKRFAPENVTRLHSESSKSYRIGGMRAKADARR